MSRRRGLAGPGRGRRRRLLERAPEERVGTVLVLLQEEGGSGLDELVQADVAVVVRVDRLEGRRRQGRVEAEDLEELLVLRLVNQVVVVGVDAVEEERQRALEHALHRRVVDQLRHRLDELRQLDGVAAAQHAQVLVPHLQRTNAQVYVQVQV